MTTIPIHGTPQSKRARVEGVLGLLALFFIAVAWFLGAMRNEADLVPSIRKALPEAGHIVQQDDGLYACWEDSSAEVFLGYVAIGIAGGYGGPLQVAVAIDSDGAVTGTVVAGHKETSGWMARVLKSDLMESFRGKRYTDSFEIGSDLDGVTGATYTSKALGEAVMNGSRALAKRLDLPVEPLPAPQIVFGLPEIVLLGLFVVGFLGHQGRFAKKQRIRWASMLVGLVVLGFVYNSPVTLAYITKMILGYWPQWQTNLYWYFLIGGILFIFTVDNKNPYCHWFCPFGAAQECMGVIGGAKSPGLIRYAAFLKWFQRIFALSAILLGVYFRSPGLASYELFGTLFSLMGSYIEFVALGLVLIAALFIKRPWCRYLCPITPVVDLIRVFRKMVKEQWRRIRQRPKTV